MSHDQADMHHQDIDKHVRTYLMVFGTLLVLTIITVGISYLHLPVATAIGLALLVATIKGSLVACFFMHLISEKKLILSVLLLTVVFFFFVLFGPLVTEMNPVEL